MRPDSRMKKLVTVIGTRPQFIKYAALNGCLKENFNEVLIDTGQHYDANLSSHFQKEFNIPNVTHRLQLVESHPGRQLAEIILRLDHLFEMEKPEIVLCFGDTTSALAAALSAIKRGIEVIHLEAGERNFTAEEIRVPVRSIPEETNRVLTDHLSSLLICASQRGFSNLIAESVTGAVYFAGDIMYDLYLRQLDSILSTSTILEQFNLIPQSYYYCTVHRAINTDSATRLTTILDALFSLDSPVVFPLHPRTRKELEKWQLFERLESSDQIHVLEPLTYADSIMLSRQAKRVLTDSGGVLREAFFGQVPSVCLDDTTAWLDIIHSGWSFLAGANTDRILQGTQTPTPTMHPELFGTGNAVEHTMAALNRCYN